MVYSNINISLLVTTNPPKYYGALIPGIKLMQVYQQALLATLYTLTPHSASDCFIRDFSTNITKPLTFPLCLIIQYTYTL